MRYTLLAFLLLGSCGSPPAAPERPEDAVVIRDAAFREEEEDDFESECRFVRRGEFYVHGDRRVPAGLIEELRRVALAAPAEFEDLPPELGITPAAVSDHELDMFDAAIAWHEDLSIDIPDDIEELLGYEAVRRVALEMLVDDPYIRTDTDSLTVHLPGNPPLLLKTESQSPWLQPWTVSVDGRERKVCSLEISRIVAFLAHPRGYYAQLLDGTRYWAREFWHDEDVWSDALGEVLVNRQAVRFVRELPGHDRLVERFRVRSTTIGNINQQPTSLFTELESLEPAPIDAARVWNRIEDSEPVYDWNDGLAVLDAAAEAVRRFPALTRWKAQDKDRRIRLSVAGAMGLSETDPGTWYDPPWNHAGLKGAPEFELGLIEGGRFVGTAVLSAHADGALLSLAGKAFPEAKGLSYHPKNPTYAILRPDGKIEAGEVGR